MGKKVILGLSGGIDSAVAATRLKAEGCTVIGVTLVMHDLEAASSESGADAAKRVAEALGIECHVADYRTEFREQVLQRCWDAYSSGRTPNPCVLCNPAVKFAALAEWAERLGADFIATGHYARIQDGMISRGADKTKDQTYFLYALPAAIRNRLLFPLGELTKECVREEAKQLNLPNVSRPESQDICCAVPDRTFAELLCETFDAPVQPGNYVDVAGKILGRHGGVHLCTVGQRRGLGIALGKPAAVTQINPVTGDITLTTEPDDLLATTCSAVNPVWLSEPLRVGDVYHVQTRYRQLPVEARVTRSDDAGVTVEFTQPIRAITPGQSLVFYRGDLLLGGGEITIAP